MDTTSDRRFLAVARTRLVHLFPNLPGQTAYFKRRRRLTDTIEWLMAVFTAGSPGASDKLLLIDSTPVSCAASRENVKRSALAEVAGYGYCAVHSRFWGMRLHVLCAPDGTRRALTLASPKRDVREVSPDLLERCARRGGELLICDKGHAGRWFAEAVADLGTTVVRLACADEPGHGPHLAHIRQRIESIFWTCKDLLSLERLGARTMAGLCERVLQRFLCPAAYIGLNHRLGRPSRTLVDYCGA